MEKRVFTLLISGLFLLLGSSAFAQSYGFYTEKPAWMANGDFLNDPNLDGATIQPDKNAMVSFVSTGHEDSVYFGMNAVHATFTDNEEGKDRLEFKVGTDADFSLFNSGQLVFWIKLLAPTNDINFELSANRNDAGEAKGNDISMKDEMGLDVANDTTWQMMVVDLALPVDGDDFTFDIWESFSFRSRGNASDFLIDEMHVEYYGAFSMFADRPGWMTDGDFLTDYAGNGAFIAADKNATVTMITSGHADSVYSGDNAIYVNLTDDAEGKDRLEIKVEQDADLGMMNHGVLKFWIKLLAPTTDINFEISANRNNAGEAKGNDISMKDELGLDVNNDSTWQMVMVELSEPIDGDHFSFEIFESMGFRSRGNASEFLVDEIHVVLSGSFAFSADKAAYMMDGDFLTDYEGNGAFIAGDKNATVSMVTTGDSDSVYFGDHAIYVNLTDDAEGKDRLEIKVEQDANMAFLNNGELHFWIKLLAPVTDINFEISANRNDAGEAKGTDVSMKDKLGLDVGNDSTWQKISVALANDFSGDFFTFDVFESLGFRSRGNASEFLVDEIYVQLTSPLERYVDPPSTDATLSDLTVSVGTLDPVFSSEVTAYTLLAPVGTTVVTVSATATDTSATVAGTGDVDLSSGAAVATVTVTAEDGETTMNYTIDITRDATGIADDPYKFVRVYPVPARDLLYVEPADMEVSMVELVNLLGQTVRSQRADSQLIVFDLNDLNEGLYIVRFDGKPVRKVTINR